MGQRFIARTETDNKNAVYPVDGYPVCGKRPFPDIRFSPKQFFESPDAGLNGTMTLRYFPCGIIFFHAVFQSGICFLLVIKHFHSGVHSFNQLFNLVYRNFTCFTPRQSSVEMNAGIVGHRAQGWASRNKFRNGYTAFPQKFICCQPFIQLFNLQSGF